MVWKIYKIPLKTELTTIRKTDGSCRLPLKSSDSPPKSDLRSRGWCIVMLQAFSEFQFLLSLLRFASPKKQRFEDQIETFPYFFRDLLLARYPRFYGVQNHSNILDGCLIDYFLNSSTGHFSQAYLIWISNSLGGRYFLTNYPLFCIFNPSNPSRSKFLSRKEA